MQGFVERCMVAVGTKPHHARSLAEVLVEGDHRGHYSHGLNRMGEWTPVCLYTTSDMRRSCSVGQIMWCLKPVAVEGDS